MKKVLCLCPDNRSLSPMFEAMFQQAIDQAGQSNHVQIESAGILQSEAGFPAHKEAVLCMQKVGLDLKDHRSQWLASLNLMEYNLVLFTDNEVAQAFFAYSSNPSLGFAGKGELINAPIGLKIPERKSRKEYGRCAGILSGLARRMVGHLEI